MNEPSGVQPKPSPTPTRAPHGSGAADGLSRASFAAEVLEIGAVLERFALGASTSLGRRALAELAPRDDAGARDALTRLREMDLLEKAKDLPSLAGITDPKPILAHGARGIDEPRLMALRAFADAVGRMKKWFAERVEDIPALGRVALELAELAPLVEAVDRVLDERGKVRDEASTVLARLRRDVVKLGDKVEQRLREVLARGDLKVHLSDGAVHRRGGRPVLAVKAKSAGRVRGIVHDRSQSEQTVFVEPQAAVELGNRLAEAQADERREVERVLLELAVTVMEFGPSLMAAAEQVAEVELAMIGMAAMRRYRARPALLPGEEGAARGMLLRGARHPLLLREVELGHIPEVVPIDLRLGAEFDMLIITGPNTGGKTLALKTAGLFALLTRMGLPLPAEEGTTVPLYDGIAADIGDEQEISQNLSTFASHLVRIRDGLQHATADTLVLLDELGGGTDPDEGAALGEAVLENLLERGAPTLVSTHLGRLKELAFRRARAENACTEFDHSTLAPCYRLLLGTPGESGALVIARRMGIPQAVVDLASDRMERRDEELLELMDDVRHARVAAEDVRNRAEQQLDHARRAAEDAREKAAELERRGSQLEAEAQRGLEERVREAMRQLEAARKLLEQLPRETAGPMAERLDAIELHLSGEALGERRREFLEGLGKGKLIYLPRYKKRVLIHKVDRAKREVTVKLGAMTMRVPFEEVTWYESL